MVDVDIKPWRLVNLKVKHDVLERIDAAAHAAGMNRTTFIIQRCDPGTEKRKGRAAA